MKEIDVGTFLFGIFFFMSESKRNPNLRNGTLNTTKSEDLTCCDTKYDWTE